MHGSRRVDEGILGFHHELVAVGVDGRKGDCGGGGFGAARLVCKVGQAGVTDPGIESLDPACGNVGVEAVLNPGDVVVGPCSFGGRRVVEVGVYEAVAPGAV